MINALIIDDEHFIAQDLANRIGSRPGWTCQWSVSPEAALEQCMANDIDVCFVDIEMPEISGLDLVTRILAHSPDTRVVFVTAYQQYAIDAIRLRAVDYLVKPVGEQLLGEALGRVEQALSSRSDDQQETEIGETIPVRSGRNVDLVRISRIIGGQSESNYVSLVTRDRKYFPRAKLADFVDRLAPYGFIQTHRSFFVNPALVVSAKLRGDRIGQLRLLEGFTSPVSDTFAESVSAALGDRLMTGRF